MAIGSLALRTTVTTTGAAAWEIKAPSTQRIYIRELGIILAAATASTYGVGRPANSGSTVQSTPTLIQAGDPADSAFGSNCALAWTTAPTAPTQFFRRIGLPGTIGAGIVWQFERGVLVVPASGSLVVWNLATNSAATEIHVVAEE